STEFRSDIPYSKTILNQLGESYRKLRNTYRFLLMNLYDFEPSAHPLERAELTELDRYAMARLRNLVDEVRRAYDEYQFHVVYRPLMDSVTVELSAFSLDVLKDRLSCDGPDSASRRAAQAVMHEIARSLAALAAPILCFTAEEVWDYLPHDGDDASSVHLVLMPSGAPLDAG